MHHVNTWGETSSRDGRGECRSFWCGEPVPTATVKTVAMGYCRSDGEHARFPAERNPWTAGPRRLQWNEGGHVDRVRVEYRDPNDAGVSPPRRPALVFATSEANRVVAGGPSGDVSPARCFLANAGTPDPEAARPIRSPANFESGARLVAEGRPELRGQQGGADR